MHLGVAGAEAELLEQLVGCGWAEIAVATRSGRGAPAGAPPHGEASEEEPEEEPGLWSSGATAEEGRESWAAES